MKKVSIWGPWNDNPSKSENFYGISENRKENNEIELNEDFSSWYEGNKHTESLRDEYINSIYKLAVSERPSFKEWCKQRYDKMKYEGNVRENVKDIKQDSISETSDPYRDILKDLK